jgi:competence protein ComEC
VRAPALLPAIALVAGAVAGISYPTAPDLRLVLIVAGTTAAVAWWRRRAALVVAGIACGYFLCGVQLGATETRRAIETPVRAALDAAFGGFRMGAPGVGGIHPPLHARGRLLEDAAVRDSGVSLRISLDSITIPRDSINSDAVPPSDDPPGLPVPVSGTVLMTVNGDAAARAAEQWRAGRTFAMPATFRRPARYLNDGVADFERETALSGVTLGATVKSALLVEIVRHGNVFEEMAAAARARVRRSVRRWMSDDPLGAAIVTAILIGDRTGLPVELRDRLQVAGTYHVIAISGGNIAILAALTIGVLTVIGVRPRARALAVIVSLLAYASIVTSGASVWRATLTAVTYLAARVWDHRSPPWNAAALSAAVLVCWSPLDVRDVGFVLTFGATIALIAVAGAVGRSLAVPAAIRWPLVTVAASVAVQAVLVPVEAWTFSRVSVAGVVLNLAALPLMTMAQLAGLVMVAPPADAAARLAAWTASLSTAGLVESANLLDRLPSLARHVPPPFPGVAACYYAVLAFIVWKEGFGRWIAWGLLVVLAGLVITGHPRRAAMSSGGLSLTVFDVGQGDAMLLTLPDGSRTMVDAGGIGYGESSFDIGTRVLEPALWAKGVYRLASLVLTHGDPDHIGGAAALTRDLRPLALHEGVEVPRHLPSRMVARTAQRSGVRRSFLRRGDAWSAGSARVRVLNPQAPDWERPKVRNDDSVVLEVSYGDVAMLLTGDISGDVEREIIPLLSPSRLRILKVGHHGSRTSTSQALLDAWRPDIALISCGRGNPFGHPHPDVLERLRSVGTKVLRTDLHGQITIESDGKSIRHRTFAGAP